MSNAVKHLEQRNGPPIPPLENGDHLTRAEFERRYAAMPHVKKAELIEGVVYMPSPVRASQHGIPHADLITILGHYRIYTHGVFQADNSTIRLDLDNEPQPDACLFIDPACGGTVKLVDGYIEGSPELVAEISASTVSIDLNDKLRAYRRNGVQEYLVWRVLDKAFDWFALREGTYVPLPAGPKGIHRSEAMPGLWIDVKALLKGDLRKVNKVLDQGLASPEHERFVKQLRTFAKK